MSKIFFFFSFLCLAFPLNLFSSPPQKAGNPSTADVYPGWVQIRSHKAPSTQPEEAQEDENASIENTKESQFYVNKKEAAQCIFLDMPGENIIRLFLPKQGEMMEYNSKYKGVAFGTLHPNEARRIAAEVAKYPMTVDEMVKMIKESKADVMGTQEEKDGPYTRRKIIFMGGSLCSGKDVGGQNTIWYDPKTRWIHKLQANFGQGDQEMTYTYLTKNVKDIFDLGAPRDALVLDYRTDPETNKLLDRLDTRIDRDYGDYVAVLTQTNHGQPWGNAKKMFLYLYGRQGKNAYYGVYTLRQEIYSNAPLLKVQGWPTPDLNQVLDLAGKTTPIFFYATDGMKVCSGSYDPQNPIAGQFWEHHETIKKCPWQLDYRLVNHIWKGRDSLYLWGFGIKPDIVADSKNHPNGVGLRTREGDFSPNARPQRRTEKIFWLDPTRDDMTLEATTCEECFLSPKDPPAEVNFKIRYLKYARLPDGRWYPTHWENQLTRKGSNEKTDIFFPKMAESFSLEYYLQVFPNAKLGPSWYGSRVTALKVGVVKSTVSPKHPKKILFR